MKNYLSECITKDRDNIINKISKISLLKELYQTYVTSYGFFNSEFESFASKLNNLGTLSTVLLGFSITIAIFFLEQKYFSFQGFMNIIGIALFIISICFSLTLLILVCNGLSFKKHLTMDPSFPVSIAISEGKDIEEKLFYKKMIFCLYKIVRFNYDNLENTKKIFSFSFKMYILNIFIFIFSIILIYVGSIK